MTIHKSLRSALIFGALCCATSLFGQSTQNDTFDASENIAQSVGSRTALAMADPEYPITPGDSLSLSYMGATGSSTLFLSVDADYSINLGFFGTIDAKGLSYIDVREQIKALARRAYPNSYPSVSLRSVGSFYVIIEGEVDESGEVTAWGLSRLSEVLDSRIAAYGTKRKITVTTAAGTAKTYDLFLAERKGDLSENPLVRPGDRISVGASVKRVALRGEVQRPGDYELTGSDTLGRLIEYYGGGLIERGDAERIRVTRYEASGSLVSNRIIDFSQRTSQNLQLQNLDTVYVEYKGTRLPTVYLEGAVVLPDSEPASNAATSENATGHVEAEPETERLRVSLFKGDSLYSILLRNKNSLAPTADLRRGFIARAREDNEFNIDMESLLYQHDLSKDIALLSGDRIVIPFGDVEVFVSGEVTIAERVNVTPITRLSVFLEDRITPYASTRNVMVKPAQGVEKEYDLFVAQRFGRIDQDPYLRPGDAITVGHLDRVVSIAGEVERPGQYELLSGEGLEELLLYYGSGLTDRADRNRIELVRSKTGDGAPIERFLIDYSAGDHESIDLLNLDVITVPNRFDQLPVAYLEGAVPDGRVRKPLRKGDTLYAILKRSHEEFSADADLQRAFIRREGKEDPILINMERLLYLSDLSLDLSLESGDRIVVPAGIMEVFVTGEVEQSEWITVDPLTRLSDVLDGRITEFSSTRNVQIRSYSGTEEQYDLFLAGRFGKIEEDPYLQSNDTVVIGRAIRKVEIVGEIERPGTYELVDGDGLVELIEYYGNGLTINANESAVEIVRLQVEDSQVTQKLYIDLSTQDCATCEIRDHDTVYIPSKLLLLPYVFFEGAVLLSTDEKTGVELGTSSRFRYRYHAGEFLSEALEQIQNQFSPESDLANAYVIRQSGETLSINMEALLRRSETEQNIKLEQYDRFIIPFKQYFIVVAGAVKIPGRYPYIPDRTYKYYIDLAGGYDSGLHVGAAVNITDIDNKRVARESYIEPETKISAPINNVLYYINQLSGVFSVVGTILSILALTGVFGGT